jgi:hypothetical protein
MTKFLFNAEFNLQDGSLISGPVTTDDDAIFLFHNTNSSLHLYFRIKLINNSWQFVDGSEGLSFFEEIIETVGKQIEGYYLGESS